MKRNTLNLFVILLTLTLFVSSCKKEKYAPSLTLDIEPYVVYYDNQKYTLYDEQGNKANDIPSYVAKQGDIQQYIDLKTLIKYTVDDNGEFWSAQYLNANYKYPGYRVSAYGDVDATVSINYDPSIGVENGDGIDLALVGIYTFTYTATADGETSKKVLHLRVYNSYSNMAGQYVCRLSKLNVGGAGVSLWTDNYGYGEADKQVNITVDPSTDKKLSLNRILNNSKLKGVVKGEAVSFPTNCVIGAKKGDKNIIETIVKGEVVDNDPYIAQVAAQIGTDRPDTITTLVVVTNRTVDNITTGRITEVPVQNTNGDQILVPLIAIEYTVQRYKSNANSQDYIANDGTHWEELDSPSQNWKNTFRETFIKNTYWTSVNKDMINSLSGHVN